MDLKILWSAWKKKKKISLSLTSSISVFFPLPLLLLCLYCCQLMPFGTLEEDDGSHTNCVCVWVGMCVCGVGGCRQHKWRCEKWKKRNSGQTAEMKMFAKKNCAWHPSTCTHTMKKRACVGWRGSAGIMMPPWSLALPFFFSQNQCSENPPKPDPFTRHQLFTSPLFCIKTAAYKAALPF